MNILFIAPIVPYPLIDGDRQRAFHLLKALTKKHQVHLLCFTRCPQDQEALQALKKLGVSVDYVPISKAEIIANACLGWFSKTPLNVLAFQKKAMHKKIATIIKDKNIRALHGYRLRMAPYLLNSQGVYRVLDYTDSMHRYFKNRQQENRSLFKQSYIQHETKRLKKYEAWVSDYMDKCLVSSPHDQTCILENGSAPWIEVVSNGVEVSEYENNEPLTKEPVVLFVGNMKYVPNKVGMQWFCRYCWPLIQKKYPKAILQVAGLTPSGTTKQKHQLFPGATFLGVVDYLADTMKKARVAICPVTIASGRQFKVIEYFAASRPTVTTSLVAKNLDAKDGQHVLVADEACLFADQVLRLLGNDELADKIRAQAYQLAGEQYDWSIAEKKIQHLYEQLEDANNAIDSSQPGSMIDKIKQRQVLRIRRK